MSLSNPSSHSLLYLPTLPLPTSISPTHARSLYAGLNSGQKGDPKAVWYLSDALLRILHQHTLLNVCTQLIPYVKSTVEAVFTIIMMSSIINIGESNGSGFHIGRKGFKLQIRHLAMLDKSVNQIQL